MVSKGYTFTCTYCGKSVVLKYPRTSVPKFCTQACYHAHREATKDPQSRRRRAACHPDRPHAAFGLCSSCYWRQDYTKHREAYRTAGRKHNLKKHYGMSLEDYDKKYRDQRGRCAICPRPTRKRGLVVDHCHRTNVVRALLCNRCNTGLGAFDDDPKLLCRALNYLRKYTT